MYALIAITLLLLAVAAFLLYRTRKRSRCPVQPDQLPKHGRDRPELPTTHKASGPAASRADIPRDGGLPTEEKSTGEIRTVLSALVDDVAPEDQPRYGSTAEVVPTRPSGEVLQDMMPPVAEQPPSERDQVDVNEPVTSVASVQEPELSAGLSHSRLEPQDKHEDGRDDVRGMEESETGDVEESTPPPLTQEELESSPAPSGIQLQTRGTDEVEVGDTHGVFEAPASEVEEPAPSAFVAAEPEVRTASPVIEFGSPDEDGIEKEKADKAVESEVAAVEERTKPCTMIEEPLPSTLPRQVSESPEDETADTAEGERLDIEPDASTADSADDVLSVTRNDPAKRIPAERPRTPRQYRPPVRAPSPARDGSQSSQTRRSLERSLPIDVRLLFERGGFAQVSLLARRQLGLPEEILVAGSKAPLELRALQDNYYQDVVLPHIGTLLRQGIEWQGHDEYGHELRWSLSGRELYVLSPHNDLSGFVSTARLVLGREHVVLCTSNLLRDVQDVIAETGSPVPRLLDSADGIPAGWTGLQGVLPREPVPQSAEQDILNILRPLPDAEIVLEGGIRLEYSTWLAEFPPRIRLYGDSDAIGEVIIDEQTASLNADGSYTVAGWDAAGTHTVWCTSSSRTYSIKEGTEEWDTWDAYSWIVYDQTLRCWRSLPTICGALVEPKKPSHHNLHTVILPAVNPVVIGSKPGETFTANVRTDICPDCCIGLTPFEPVWALPADPYHSDKRVARVVLIGDIQAVRRQRGHAAFRQTDSVLAWCSVILAAGRKGLHTEPNTREVSGLWREYRRQAKRLWKRLR